MLYNDRVCSHFTYLINPLSRGIRVQAWSSEWKLTKLILQIWSPSYNLISSRKSVLIQKPSVQICKAYHWHWIAAKTKIDLGRLNSSSKSQASGYKSKVGLLLCSCRHSKILDSCDWFQHLFGLPWSWFFLWLLHSTLYTYNKLVVWEHSECAWWWYMVFYGRSLHMKYQ